LNDLITSIHAFLTVTTLARLTGVGRDSNKIRNRALRIWRQSPYRPVPDVARAVFRELRHLPIPITSESASLKDQETYFRVLSVVARALWAREKQRRGLRAIAVKLREAVN